MKFKKLVSYLDKLEKTSSRLKITDILVDLLREIDTKNVREAIYLTLGMLGPDFESVEFGMASKMVIRAVAQAASVENKEVEKAYKKEGDLGEVVKKMRINGKEEGLEVEKVFNRLLSCAKEAGFGSQERKVEGVVSLLLSTSPDERKYIVRVIMGKLRLGFSSKTILDALSQLEAGNKSLRKQLDAAFQIYPDVGLLAEKLKEKGIAGLSEIKVKSGVPIMSALCQRLNNYEEIVKKMGDLAVERKYDGTRVQIHFDRKKGEIKTYTRNLEDSSKMFPELKNLPEWIKGDEVILDSEAVGVDKKTGKVLPFQVTITRKRKHGVEKTAESVPLVFYLFDILAKDGRSLLAEPYHKRRGILDGTIKRNEVVVIDEYIRTDDPKEIEKLHEQYLSEGLEGAVIKKWDGGYLPGRQGWNWVKIKEAEGTTGKLADTLDLSVMGYYYGKGKRVGFGMGAFLAGLRKEGRWVSIAKIGTGLSDEQFREMRVRLDKHAVKEKPEDYLVSKMLEADVWVEPGVVVEIAADELTKSPAHAGGLALRFPRLVKFRDDKNPDQTTTWSEVEQINKISQK